MKATIEILDELMREIKVRAANEDTKLKEIIPELSSKGMAAEERSKVRHRVHFPIVETLHPAPSGEELTPERVHEILLGQEVQAALRVAGND
jgi:hypothetical protein